MKKRRANVEQLGENLIGASTCSTYVRNEGLSTTFDVHEVHGHHSFYSNEYFD